MEHLNLVRRIAWSFHNTTGIDWEELFAEASLAYCYAINTYEPDKGRLGPYVSGFINKHLCSFLEKERRDKFVDVTALVEGTEGTVYQVPFFELFDALSDDSKILAKVVLNNPHKFLEVPSKMARGLVVVHMVKKMGWTWTRVRESIRNIKAELVEIS